MAKGTQMRTPMARNSNMRKPPPAGPWRSSKANPPRTIAARTPSKSTETPTPAASANLPSPLISTLLPRHPDPLLHLIQILGQCCASFCRQSVLSPRHAPLKKLHARDVFRLFQLSRMHAQISIGGLEHALQIVDTQRIISRQRTHNPQPDTLVYQSVQFGQFRSSRRCRFTRMLARAHFMLPGLSTRC